MLNDDYKCLSVDFEGAFKGKLEFSEADIKRIFPPLKKRTRDNYNPNKHKKKWERICCFCGSDFVTVSETREHCQSNKCISEYRKHKKPKRKKNLTNSRKK